MASPPLEAAFDSASAAARLRDCYARRQPIAPIGAAFPSLTIEDAYAVQALNREHWEAAGRTVIGAKIGLTAKSVQRQLGVVQPDFGSLFADMSVRNGDTVAMHRLIQPRVEAEIAFVLARAPRVDRLTSAELIDSIAYALPAIEIVDSRIAEWRIDIFDTIADNASSGLFVLGDSPVKPAELDLRLCGMVLERNGEPLAFGAGAACLGNPLNALGWLVAKMAEVGRPLGEGDIILSGALGPMLPVAAGDRIEARIEGLGAVRVDFGREA